MVRFKNRKLLDLQSVSRFKRILERIKMSKNLISKPKFKTKNKKLLICVWNQELGF